MTSPWRALFKTFFPASPKRRRRAISFRSLERLEDRCLPAVLVNIAPDQHTTEAGRTATITVSLDTQPTANVEIPVSSLNTKEGTVDVANLTFTTDNWQTPQTVTVKGVNDFVIDGEVRYTIRFNTVRSNDPSYGNLNPEDVTLSNLDDDVASILVTPTSGLITTEQGGSATFNVKLTSQPTATVQLRMHSTNFTEGTNPNPITFNRRNWQTGINVTIKGVNDFVDDGDVPYQITFDPAQGSATEYVGKVAATVSLVNLNDDFAGMSLLPTSGLIIKEGKHKNVTVRINSQPTSNVTVNLNITSGNDAGTLSASSVVFTPTNWNAPKVITIKANKDPSKTVGIVGGALGLPGFVPLVFTATASSDDPKYNFSSASPSNFPGSRLASNTAEGSSLQQTVTVQIQDADVAGISYTPAAAFTINEGAAKSITVKLTANPARNVTINFSASNGEATVSPSSLTFTPENWNVAQTATIQGVADGVADGTKTCIITATSQSEVAAYNGLTKTYSVTVKDVAAPVSFDGTYVGSYSGTVSGFGVSAPTSGSVRFTIQGNTISVTVPEAGSGTINSNGSSQFSSASGGSVGARFSGSFTRNANGSITASGSWVVTLTGFSGGGTWNARKI